MRKILFLVALALFVLASCGGNGSEQNPDENTSSADTIETTVTEQGTPAEQSIKTSYAEEDYQFPKIEGKVWELASYTMDGSSRDLQDSSILTMTIEGDKIFGSGGCNSYNGGVQLQSDGVIKIGELATTKMLCRNIMTQEQVFLQLLQEAQLYSVNQLFMEIESKNGSLSFRSGI
ncbi:MAG: META domain-containing protein [Chitinophagales bacterium]|nr:META domain-containing protein [Chitinophagales bacterium]